MQTTLLGIALALITAILAAFAAPFFIDWNEWRPQLEAQASALAGSRVTITGNIELTILPTPAFVLREVSLGDAGKGTGMRASEMRGSLSLTALLSGRIEASEFVLSRPSIRLVVDKDGRLLLPSGASAGQEISVSGFVLEAGSITIEDRRTNSLLSMEDFSARGELVSREGPFRLDGGFRLNGMRWIVRASSGRFGPDHAGKARLSLERPSDGVSFDAEGLLGLANAAPRFDGKLTLAQRSGDLPWRISADSTGDVAELRLANLDLALGKGELPITLSGEAKVSPHANGTIEATLSSKRIDLDLGDQNAGVTGAAHVLPLLSGARSLFALLPLASTLNISADGVLAGGQLVRDVRAGLRSQNGAVTLERLEARMPGRAAITLSGKNDGGRFSGPLVFEADEPQIFARWLLGAQIGETFPVAETLRVKGDLAFAPGSTSIRNLDAAIGSALIGGEIAIRPAETAIKLTLRKAEIDVLIPLLWKLDGFGDGADVSVELAASDVRFLDTPIRQGKLKALLRGKKAFALQQLDFRDFDGTSITAKESAGAHEFSAEITRGGGFAKLLTYLSGSPDLADLAGKYADSHFPLRLSGTLSRLKEGWRLLAKSGEAALALDLGALQNARRPVDAVLRLPETEISAKGELRFAGERVSPALALSLKSTDLRKALVLADRASSDVLPASGTASLVRDGNRFVFEKLAFDIAGSRGNGNVAIPAGGLSPFSGELTLDRADAAVLISLALGRAKVSYLELSVPPLANLPGTLKMEVGSLAVPGRMALQNAAFQLRAGKYETVFDDFRAQFAGGKLSGSLRIADFIPRVLEINLAAEGVALDQLFPQGGLRGLLRTTVALGANGSTEEDLIASLAGRGTLSLSNLEIARTDATAVSAVFASVKDVQDEKKIEHALLAALDRASLKVSKLEAPLVIANGIVRSGSAKAQAGNIGISLSGALNLPKRSVDALLNIEVSGGTAAKPGALLHWSGPFHAPERKVDAKALIAAIALRTIESGGGLQQPEERAPLPKKKLQPARKEIETVPLLPPPTAVPSAPLPHGQN